MVRITTRRTVWSAALGATAMLMLAAPALADPSDPAPALPGPDPTQPVQVLATGQSVPQAAPVPHLSSPDNLPPGTSETPTESGHRLSYLRDLWHAVQTQEVSGGDALLLLTQRPMDADAVSPNGLPSGPQPIPPADPLVPAPPAPTA